MFERIDEKQLEKLEALHWKILDKHNVEFGTTMAFQSIGRYKREGALPRNSFSMALYRSNRGAFEEVRKFVHNDLLKHEDFSSTERILLKRIIRGNIVDLNSIAGAPALGINSTFLEHCGKLKLQRERES